MANLGAERQSFDRNFELEILHSRWAMLSALGILVPGELLPPFHISCCAVDPLPSILMPFIYQQALQVSWDLSEGFQLSAARRLLIIAVMDSYQAVHRPPCRA